MGSKKSDGGVGVGSPPPLVPPLSRVTVPIGAARGNGNGTGNRNGNGTGSRNWNGTGTGNRDGNKNGNGSPEAAAGTITPGGPLDGAAASGGRSGAGGGGGGRERRSEGGSGGGLEDSRPEVLSPLEDVGVKRGDAGDGGRGVGSAAEGGGGGGGSRGGGGGGGRCGRGKTL